LCRCRREWDVKEEEARIKIMMICGHERLEKWINFDNTKARCSTKMMS
jgi:hypothetical protein